MTLADQVQKVSKASFGAAWEEAADSGYCELEDMFALTSMNSLEQAVSSVISFLGLQPAERSDKVPSGKSSHTLFLAGDLFYTIQICTFIRLAKEKLVGCYDVHSDGRLEVFYLKNKFVFLNDVFYTFRILAFFKNYS